MSGNSQNNNKYIQSAGNQKGSSETIRQLSHNNMPAWFASWLAGVIDGGGNFDIRNVNGKRILKGIRIKFHIRDLKILNIIQNHLHCGSIRIDKKKPYCLYTIGIKKDIVSVINLINGFIRLKVPGFEEACNCLTIDYIEADYILKPLDPYFAGLIDTDGSVIFNYPSNRIECNLELKYNQYSEKLILDFVIPHYKPSRYLRMKTCYKGSKTLFKSIAFKYQTVQGMTFLYEYFMKNRLYCDMKFYRISKIKRFLEIRHYHRYPKASLESQIYASFLLDFIQYQNPLWTRVPFVQKILLSDKEIVHHNVSIEKKIY